MPKSIDTVEKNTFKASCYDHVAVLGQFLVDTKREAERRSVYPRRIITGKEKAFENKL